MKRRRKYLQSGARLFRQSMLIGLHRNSDLLQVPFLLPHRAKQLAYFFRLIFVIGQMILHFDLSHTHQSPNHSYDEVHLNIADLIKTRFDYKKFYRDAFLRILTFSNFFLLRFSFLGFLYSVTGCLLPTIFKLTQYLLWQKFGATSSPESSQYFSSQSRCCDILLESSSQ